MRFQTIINIIRCYANHGSVTHSLRTQTILVDLQVLREMRYERTTDRLQMHKWYALVSKLRLSHCDLFLFISDDDSLGLNESMQTR